MSGLTSAVILIELVVVMEVLVILILTLVPAVATPHEASHRAVCQDNVRRLMQAVVAVMGTFGGEADWILVTKFQAEQVRPGPGLLWCNPSSSDGR